MLDVNSLYPHIMHDKPIPFGEGKHYTGKYVYDSLYNIYFQFIRCNFVLKPSKLPTIQLKNNFSFAQNEYVTDSNGEDIELCLSNVDLKLFLEQYDVFNIEYLHGWKFKSTLGMFTDYIDKWINIKIQAAKNGNEAMRTLAKLMLNALYGKLALNPRVRSKYPMYDNGAISYKLGPEETRKPIYIPAGAMITSYAREKTIRAAQSVYDRFIYADTDSLHLIDCELPKELDIDHYKLGAWDDEAYFNRARYIRAKTYIEDCGDKCIVKCAGMPDACKEFVTWENFHVGSKFNGKLAPDHVRGGIVLKDIDFTILE